MTEMTNFTIAGQISKLGSSSKAVVIPKDILAFLGLNDKDILVLEIKGFKKASGISVELKGSGQVQDVMYEILSPEMSFHEAERLAQRGMRL